MANVIKLRKGLDINLKGKAAEELVTVKEPGFYSLVPDDFTGITPKVVVKEQEYVMAGGPLFIDKNHPELNFVSPVSGVVTSVERGARRKVLNIVVEAATEQDYEEFGKMDPSKMNAEEVKAALLKAGMFAFIRQRPYDVIADPTVAPKAIFVSAFDSNPLAPNFEFALKGEEKNFQTGLDALAKMAKTYLSISVKQKSAALTGAKNVTITAFDGPVNHQTDIFGNLNPVLIQRQRNAAGEIIGINKQPLRTLLHFPECLHCGISELFHIHHRTISMNPVFRIFPLVPDAKPVFGGMMKQ